ncbi:hypothetical protein SAMD00019534_110950 [Acytostelium subglobosum LB1]|uniref:hypothetical protein n=1 Tax=Acytostelium subglobosum LB1 TaxID=1410327 RepID=UPI0006448E28|nr:hypothetical protein SAMD00019534_110950 [Acytostelium subglobosum LB1]GAM27919.1 hypothetical protein SAMD00019534_110950 [Acytostelium subglobosum LB1]|eukprot:XP_012749202.1 hypothetical protein SAMD00019534_110950 [Acytostelium subglobosum LB1]
MRHISLVDRIVFNWKGNVFRRAITLADVDNDGDNELIVGSLEGNLTIFKGIDKHPWKVANNIGSITCVAVGDLLDSHRNLLVVISSEGICNIYNVAANGVDQTTTSEHLVPMLSQRLPPNASAILIGDVDNDGKNELVIGTYDHTLYSFSLQKQSQQQQQQQMIMEDGSGAGDQKEWTLVCKNKWQLPGQIGTLVMAKESGGNEILIVGLCEGTNYIILDNKGQLYKEERSSTHPNIMSSSYSPPYMAGSHSSAGMGMGMGIGSDFSNSTGGAGEIMSNNETFISIDHLRKRKTDIITNISAPLNLRAGTCLVNEDGVEERIDDSDTASIIATATLDGVLKLKRVGKGIVWKMEIEEMGSGQLVALYAAPLSRDTHGNDYIVACGWDGLTVVVDSERNIVSFKFGDRVCAFTTGNYTMCRGAASTPCFVYVTFFGEIYLYHNLNIQLKPTHSLKWTTKQQMDELVALAATGLAGGQALGTVDEFYSTLLSPQFDKQLLGQYLDRLKQDRRRRGQSSEVVDGQDNLA